MKIGYDISGQVGNKVLYESLGIAFSLTPLEIETVFWNGASMGAIMPDADKMLDYINKNGIRGAVISNLLWPGPALTERLNRLLPNNPFEFVMTPSDNFMRKPNRILFDIALRKAGVYSDEIWYCGIISRQILKEHHKLVFILSGTIMKRIKTTRNAAMNTYQSINI